MTQAGVRPRVWLDRFLYHIVSRGIPNGVAGTKRSFCSDEKSYWGHPTSDCYWMVCELCQSRVHANAKNEYGTIAPQPSARKEHGEHRITIIPTCQYCC